MTKRNVIGIDLAKHVFHIVILNERNTVIERKQLKRAQMGRYFVNRPAARIGMEACASAHYWGRTLRSQGHEVRLLPPQHVKPLRQGNKNDYNDALAIAEALNRPGIHPVTIKTPEQQDLQAVERLRELTTKQRTAMANQLRGLLAEYGIVIPTGINVLMRVIPGILEDADNGLSMPLRACIAQRYRQLQSSREDLNVLTQQVRTLARQDARCTLLESIPGFGPIVAAAYVNHVGDAAAFARGRDVAASVGLVPGQHSTGGRPTLLGISKRGDKRLRYLLVHGARAVAKQADKKTDRLSVWFCQLRDRRGYNKAVVALANKLARIGWAVVRTRQAYDSAHLSTVA